MWSWVGLTTIACRIVLPFILTYFWQLRGPPRVFLNSRCLGHAFSSLLLNVILACVPAGCPGSFQPSWVLGTPARTVYCSSFLGRSSQCWPASGRAAARSPWSAWWGVVGDRVSAQWRCLMAWLSEENVKEKKLYSIWLLQADSLTVHVF